MAGPFSRNLSSRLQLAYDQLLPRADVWDVCCDHGYLGLKAHSSGQFQQIHFVDPATHLIDVLRERCADLSGIYFHPVPAQEVSVALSGNVVVAGVGAELICEIIFSLLGSAKLQVQRLVLVPHKHADKMSAWLSANTQFAQSYSLSAIHTTQEKGRVREVFVFEKRN